MVVSLDCISRQACPTKVVLIIISVPYFMKKLRLAEQNKLFKSQFNAVYSCFFKLKNGEGNLLSMLTHRQPCHSWYKAQVGRWYRSG